MEIQIQKYYLILAKKPSYTNTFVAISLTFHSKSIFSTMRSIGTLNLHPDNSQILNFPSKPEETRLTVVLIQTFELYSNMHHQTIVHVATTVIAYRLISGPFN